MIVFFPKQPSSLHMFSLLMLVAPYLSKSSQQWNVHLSPKAIFDDKDIHSLLGVAKEKVEDLPLNMYSTFQNNSCDSISKCIVGYCTLIHVKAFK